MATTRASAWATGSKKAIRSRSPPATAPTNRAVLQKSTSVTSMLISNWDRLIAWPGYRTGTPQDLWKHRSTLPIAPNPPLKKITICRPLHITSSTGSRSCTKRECVKTPNLHTCVLTTSPKNTKSSIKITSMNCSIPGLPTPPPSRAHSCPPLIPHKNRKTLLTQTLANHLPEGNSPIRSANPYEQHKQQLKWNFTAKLPQDPFLDNFEERASFPDLQMMLIDWCSICPLPITIWWRWCLNNNRGDVRRLRKHAEGQDQRHQGSAPNCTPLSTQDISRVPQRYVIKGRNIQEIKLLS